ncbi:MAG: MBL fold metallo-hydrolase [Candidatus Bipolaricaulota bacterium]|nr:MBL fold metallo-hydrolase [Candidatus Bipolaricaulota bacterium]
MRVETVCLGELATNCYLIDAGGKTILIDPAQSFEALSSFLAGRSVDLVVNTHGHFDHIGGDWDLQKRGAQLLIHKAALPMVDHFYPDHPQFDRYLNDGDLIPGGLRVMHTPGHSPGSIVLVGEGVLFVGDLLFAGSIGRTDFPGGSMDEMNRSLSRLVDLPGEYLVYPGHGPATSLDKERRTNPFLAAQGVKR